MTPPTPPATPRTVGVIWLLLMINVLGFLPGIATLVPLPRQVGQAITMACLAVAFALALRSNPRSWMRPGVFHLVLAGLAVIALADALSLQSGAGSLLRTFRLALFVATLWLLSRWYRGDVGMVRLHVKVLGAVILSVAIGILVAPGKAFSGPDGRVIGVVWPIPSTQVGQYSAVAIGLVVLLWLNRLLDGRSTLLVAIPAVVLLLLSHTRTALLGLAVGLLVAGSTVLRGNSRARRALLLTAVLGTGAGVLFGGAITDWLQRGQDSESLQSLTGRQKVWDALLGAHRSQSEVFLGVGLTDKSYGGLPIDSGWLSVYYELGLVGVACVIVLLAVLAVLAAIRPPSPARACAVFLIVYCAAASYTEVGLGDASPYLLHLAVATTLLATPLTTAEPRTSPSAGDPSAPRTGAVP
ncbi:O-antigen ligase domain-containing protein [Pseudonocardia saturnea]